MALYSCTRFWIFNFRWDELPRYVAYGVALKIIVYVSDLLDNDVIIIGIEDGARVVVQKLDYPSGKIDSFAPWSIYEDSPMVPSNNAIKG